VMFSAAYTDEFYRALRNALHYEVEQYRHVASVEEECKVGELWDVVYRLEERCRIEQPTQLPVLQSNAGLAVCGAETHS
jgi:anaerobic magnesium-protoporphyrin IX monomethyl ester cyclase